MIPIRESVPDRINRLGFNFQKLMPPVFENEKGYALLDFTAIETIGGYAHYVTFSLVIIKASIIKPEYLALVKTEILQVYPKGDITERIYKKEYWNYRTVIPNKERMLRECRIQLYNRWKLTGFII